ncbi:putative Holliday junction resolvase [Mycoplasmoides fastidiosum]|uniref:Putative pre-16S rRNA nuclease n=1 Tax=Mycoplasmoides fastidiosum TaxID=92758 RepID=A0ABU0M052_9BACT|nr:Holliday junction resolvase RuvX [Mycoplasmoides fastidiosum]MDQ0514330.1 putative Holliday junction resolvase [Mycoplasmoides fastidiosum]UUD38067.1 Holliday junction resolvase RuvX [Mycoplasmoides fastidiosum]
MTRVLGLDVGEKKIGVAITDLNQTIITPLETIRLSRFNGKQFFAQLQKILQNYWSEIGAVVLGMPYNTDQQTCSFSVKYVNQCYRMLRAWTPWTVLTQSETYSTQWSEATLNAWGYKTKTIQARSDSFAAAKILADYFVSQNKRLTISLV